MTTIIGKTFNNEGTSMTLYIEHSPMTNEAGLESIARKSYIGHTRGNETFREATVARKTELSEKHTNLPWSELENFEGVELAHGELFDGTQTVTGFVFSVKAKS